MCTCLMRHLHFIQLLRTRQSGNDYDPQHHLDNTPGGKTAALAVTLVTTYDSQPLQSLEPLWMPLVQAPGYA